MSLLRPAWRTSRARRSMRRLGIVISLKSRRRADGWRRGSMSPRCPKRQAARLSPKTRWPRVLNSISVGISGEGGLYTVAARFVCCHGVAMFHVFPVTRWRSGHILKSRADNTDVGPALGKTVECLDYSSSSKPSRSSRSASSSTGS